MRLLRALSALAMTALVFLAPLTRYAALTFAAEELRVGAQVDKKEVPSGDLLIFSITLAGSIRETPKVQLMAFEGFKIVSTGQSQSLQIRSGQVYSTLVLSYTLAPTAPGTHTLGPVKIQYHGKEYETQPIEVTVVKRPPKNEPEPNREPLSEQPELEGGVIL